jgi:XTP/dITP diphosphohydrolase
MQKIVMATSNKGKIKELETLLAGWNVKILSLEDFPQIDSIEENGSTFRENAAIKAETVAKLTGLITIADDSGLEVDALQGAPGVYSARYAGKEGNDAANNARLLRELAGVPKNNRTAQFRSVIAIATPSGDCYFTEGTCEGSIGFELKGDNGFGYDPLFITADGRTLAEYSLEEKNQISHRGLAFRKAKKILEQLLYE